MKKFVVRSSKFRHVFGCGPRSPLLRESTLESCPPLLNGLGGVPREQKMLKGNLTRVMYHQVY